MTLREAIERLGEWDDNATFYVAGEPSERSPDSEAAVGVEDVEAETESLPPEAEGKRYFLEVSVAREVLAGEAVHVARELALDEKVARVIQYATFDAWLRSDRSARGPEASIRSDRELA